MKGTQVLKKEFYMQEATIVTKGLPTNWSIQYIQLNDLEYEAKLKFINTSEQFEAIDIVTYYDIKEAIYEASEGGQVHWSGIDGKANLLHTDDESLNCSVILSSELNLDTTGGIMFELTWYIPEPSPLAFAGYDFSEKNPTNDQILAVGEKKFFVNKAVLSLYSPVFNNLFNNENFEESKKEEIELKDVYASEFAVLLHVIFPTTVSVDESNVEFLWKLADRFCISSVAQVCESFLCRIEGKRQTAHLNLSHRLKIAQTFKSDKLMLAVCDSMKKLNL